MKKILFGSALVCSIFTVVLPVYAGRILTKPRVHTLKTLEVHNEGSKVLEDGRHLYGTLVTLSGFVPRIGQSTIDVSISLDESAINEDHPCSQMNVTSFDFPDGKLGPFVADGSVVVTHVASGNTLVGVVTGGELCFLSLPIDGCEAYEGVLNFSITGGTGAKFVGVQGLGTLHVIVGGKCSPPSTNDTYLLRADAVIWELRYP